MNAQVHQEGLQYLGEVALTGQQSKPANFYVLLVNDASLAADAALADLTEVSGSGYARQAVASSSAGIAGEAIDNDDWRFTFDEVTFNATGDWTEATGWAIATTIDNTGKLIASGPLSGGSVTLSNGGSVSETPRLQFTG